MLQNLSFSWLRMPHCVQNQLPLRHLVHMKSTFVHNLTSYCKRSVKTGKVSPSTILIYNEICLKRFIVLDYTFFQKWIQNRRQLGFLPNLNMVDLPAQHPQLYCEILTTRRQEEQASSAPSRLTPNMTAEERSGWNVWRGDEEDRRERHRWMEGKLVT